MKKNIKKILKVLGIFLLIILVALIAYLIYLFASYHRIPDNQALKIEKTSDGTVAADTLTTEKEYSALTYNVGFGAYTPDFSFFMDGGRESRARSRQAVDENMRGIVAFVKGLSPDFALFQEVDTDGTRSWHIDETAYLSDAMTGCEFDEVFAQNYDSPYLFYPLIQPHGANQSGIVTLSRHPIASAARRELPVESGFMKFLDLDRCYSVSRIPTASGKELVLYNLHLSAYTSDGAIATEQLELLCADMLAEYEAGNYCVAGGDFNKDLLGNSPEIFGVAAGENDTWAQPIPEGTIPAGLTLVAPFDETAPAASCRTASEPYSIETTFRLTVDGFLVSDNVEVVDSAVLDAGFLYSDHNPVWMDFKLN